MLLKVLKPQRRIEPGISRSGAKRYYQLTCNGPFHTSCKSTIYTEEIFTHMRQRAQVSLKFSDMLSASDAPSGAATNAAATARPAANTAPAAAATTATVAVAAPAATANLEPARGRWASRRPCETAEAEAQPLDAAAQAAAAHAVQASRSAARAERLRERERVHEQIASAARA